MYQGTEVVESGSLLDTMSIRDPPLVSKPAAGLAVLSDFLNYTVIRASVSDPQ